MRYLLLLILAGPLALAKPVGPVVKVRSFVCQNPQQYRLGSGTLMTIRDKTYVLTSDHVVFPGDTPEGICHRVSNEMAENVVTKLHSLNFARKLALLEVGEPEKLAAQPVEFENLRDDDGPIEKLILSGVPFQKEPDIQIRHILTEVVDTRSRRLLAPLVPRAIETRGAVKYGMSGGAAWLQNGEFWGITTDRYEDENKKTADLRSFDPSEPLPPTIIALVIPNSVITQWIDQVFGKHPERAALYPDLDAELEGVFKVNLNGILFAAARLGDGAGVGGEEPKEVPNPVSTTGIEIPLKLQLPDKVIEWPFPHSEKWMTKLKAALTARKTVVISGFDVEGVLLPVSDLMQALTYLERGYTPIMKITGSPEQDLDQTHIQILENAKTISAMVNRLSTQVAKGRHETYLLQSIQVQISKILNSQMELVRDGDLASVIEPTNSASPFAKGWDALHTGLNATNPNVEVMNASSQMRATLRTLRTALNKVRLP
jgi:hypothetical protein